MKKITKLVRAWVYEKKTNDYETRYKHVFPLVDGKIASQPDKVVGKSVAFVVRKINRYGGGITSVLRLGTFLSEGGYSVDYVVCTNGDMAQLERNAASNLSGHKGSVRTLDSVNLDAYDMLIATHWMTAFYIKNCTPYKMYLIQDFEPYFYQYSDLYRLAMDTYNFGFHMVSLGEWNASKVSESVETSKLDTLTFPYEPKEYSGGDARTYKSCVNEKKIDVCVYIKQTKKRCPEMLQFLMVELGNKFKEESIAWNVSYYGSPKELRFNGGRNVGQLSVSQLNELYKKSDLGVVFSLTNVSLVPYEMIAAGLPIVELEFGSFPSFFNKGSAILANHDVNRLFKEIKTVLDSPLSMEKMVQNGRDSMSGCTWERTGREFVNILNGL